MIPFPSLFAAFQWWMRTAVKDCPVSVLIAGPEPVRRTIDRGPAGWRVRHAGPEPVRGAIDWSVRRV